jgi:hypothetical protein
MEKADDRDSDIRYTLRFGEIAVRKGFVTASQVKQALAEQMSLDSSARLRPHKLIGEILFEKGWITQYQIATVLEELIKNRSQRSPQSSS